MKLFNKILEEETNLKRKGTYLYGVYKKFYITSNITDLTQAISTLVIKVSVNSNSENNKNKINEYLNSIDKNKLGITFTQVNDYFCEIHISNGFEGKMIKQANEFLPNFIDFLNKEKFESGCNVCGITYNLETYKLDESYCVLCNNCVNKIQQECEEEKNAIANQKSNIIPGIFGAIIGSLIGVFAWVVIYSLGYIASLAGLITVVFAMKGYAKLGKYLDTKGILISLLISILMIYIANQLSWTIQIIAMFSQTGVQLPFLHTFISLFDILKELEIVSGENNIVSSFYGDLTIGYLLSLIVIIPYIVGLLKSVKSNKKLTKLE